MDRDLEALRRAADANPQDPHAAQHLDRHLDRAGQRETLRERYRLKFQCDLRYDDLERTPDPFRRHCARCQHPVRFVRTPDELARAVAQRECVAMVGADLPQGLDRLARHPDVSSADQPSSPCVLPSAAGFVDLDTFTPDPRALGSLGNEQAHRLSVLPLSLQHDTLTVALGDPTLPDAPGQLAKETGFTLREALADPAKVMDAILEHYGPFEPLDMLMGMIV